MSFFELHIWICAPVKSSAYTLSRSILFYTCFSVGKSVNPAISCQKLTRIYTARQHTYTFEKAWKGRIIYGGVRDGWPENFQWNPKIGYTTPRVAFRGRNAVHSSKAPIERKKEKEKGKLNTCEGGKKSDRVNTEKKWETANGET